MLSLKNINKVYKTGDFVQTALNNVNLDFRENEFVSILGESGSGKTTLLNIIGGLDRYTKGDLQINGKSTQQFKDRDWDSYRNHSVGFVFQSYNLIPHQTALANVEMALTLSGVSKKERKIRARWSLEKVGLGDHLHKRPNQMSGGQMQRIAIARALVNDPDILLADEPTGALDSKTSVQIMDLLKEIAEDRLVIMVTHNPDLAEEYSTRIVELKDGEIISDTDPYVEENTSGDFNPRETRMSFLTALSLSFNNLMSKFGRTLLTAFAGSIGIIGIALILSLSNGVQEYIDNVQEDTLTSYPLTINQQSSDLSGVFEAMEEGDAEPSEGEIVATQTLSKIMSVDVQNNDLESFKQWLEDKPGQMSDYINDIQYQYAMSLPIYANTEDGLYSVNPNVVSQTLAGPAAGGGQAGSASTFGMSGSWFPLIDNRELMEQQYDVLQGRLPENTSEVILIVDENQQISETTLYSLGLKNPDEFTELIEQVGSGENVDIETESISINFDEIIGLTYQLLPTGNHFEKVDDRWVNRSDDEAFIEDQLSEAKTLEIVGIFKPNEERQSAGTEGIAYLPALDLEMIQQNQETAIVQEQLANPETNVITNQPFPEESQEGEFDMTELSPEEQAELQQMEPEALNEYINTLNENMNATYEGNLSNFGYVEEDKPSSILFYANSFESKDLIKDAIDNYNTQMSDAGEEDKVINYTDEIGLIMSSVTSIVNMISYVLIAFVAISLIVSSIMIGIITYISVLERTKEIGILRAMGARKKDISRIFNAETFIEGLASGALGIGISLLISIPINHLVEHYTDVAGITSLPVNAAIILIIISVLLTMIAGIIPSRYAAKQDPVKALRSE
ncbi:ABC transporter ATP-binding protein/permease [Aerococcaceae bacterium DSM 111022]|nr:ABC transporter ATP-binding protein/permease [Aerococcaceae bacterium DSM 111022]